MLIIIKEYFDINVQVELYYCMLTPRQYLIGLAHPSPVGLVDIIDLFSHT